MSHPTSAMTAFHREVVEGCQRSHADAECAPERSVHIVARTPPGTRRNLSALDLTLTCAAPTHEYGKRGPLCQPPASCIYRSRPTHSARLKANKPMIITADTHRAAVPAERLDDPLACTTLQLNGLTRFTIKDYKYPRL